MRHGALFNGIGGFQLAAHWMGWENLFHCEIDKFCNQVVKRHFPESICYEDIKQTDFTPWRGAIDILTGGDPCQPSSTQGLKKGKADHRYLWPEYYRCVKECWPGRILNENVSGTITNGILDQKISDLETIGYTCWPPLIVPSGAAGALHRRDRVWLVAYANGDRRKEIYSSAIAEERRNKNLPSGMVKGDRWTATNKSDILRASNGIPGELDRAKRIKALGNAIDPHCCFEIFKAIQSYEQLIPTHTIH